MCDHRLDARTCKELDRNRDAIISAGLDRAILRFCQCPPHVMIHGAARCHIRWHVSLVPSCRILLKAMALLPPKLLPHCVSTNAVAWYHNMQGAEGCQLGSFGRATWLHTFSCLVYAVQTDHAAAFLTACRRMVLLYIRCGNVYPSWARLAVGCRVHGCYMGAFIRVHFRLQPGPSKTGR